MIGGSTETRMLETLRSSMLLVHNTMPSQQIPLPLTTALGLPSPR